MLKTKFKKKLQSLTESLDIWIFNIGLLSWMVFNNVKSSNDQRQTVESWLDETNTSLMWLTCKPLTGPRWWSIFVICTRRRRSHSHHHHHHKCTSTANCKTMKMHLNNIEFHINININKKEGKFLKCTTIMDIVVWFMVKNMWFMVGFSIWYFIENDWVKMYKLNIQKQPEIPIMVSFVFLVQRFLSGIQPNVN